MHHRQEFEYYWIWKQLVTLAGYNLQDNVYIYSNNKCMCVFLISPVPIAEPLTSELIDTPVFYNLAPRPIKYRVSVPIPSLYPPNARWGGEFEWPKTLQGPQLENCRKYLSLGVRKHYTWKKLSHSTYITTCCLGGFKEKLFYLNQKQTSAYSVIRHDWNFKLDWLLCSGETIFYVVGLYFHCRSSWILSNTNI